MRVLPFVLSLVLATACAQEKQPAADAHLANHSAHDSTTADCTYQFLHSNLCISYTWEKQPTEQAQGSIIFKTYRANTVDQTPVQVSLAQIPQLVLFMPSMGHGSSPTKVEKLDTGTYRASNIYFVMPGQWEFRFQVKSGDQVDDQAVIPVTD